MAFDLEVRFTGICSVVPDKPFNKSPTKVCVVLPNAFFEDVAGTPKARDATKLRRHRGMVRFDLCDVKGGPAEVPEAKAIWYLNKQRLTFEATGGPQELKTEDMSNMIDVTKVAPGFDTVAPEYLCWGANVSQVMFNRGVLEAPVCGPPQPWVFPGTLSKRGVPVEMKGGIASEVVLTLKDITSLTLIARHLDKGPKGKPDRLELFPGSGRTVSIEIAHLCDDNPLRWNRFGTPRVPDDDFKWHFQHVKNSDISFAKKLRGLPLPVPHPVSIKNHQGVSFENGQGLTILNGQGVNCPPAGMHPAKFNLK